MSIKNFGETGATEQGLTKFFGYPYIISGMGKATDFKFGGYIYRANLNKSPLKMLEKRERGRIQGLPKFFREPPIISGTGKATDFKFCRNIHRVDRNKIPRTMLGIVAVGVVRESRKFTAPIYRAHRAVIFATALLSCFIFTFQIFTEKLSFLFMNRQLRYLLSCSQHSSSLADMSSDL